MHRGMNTHTYTHHPQEHAPAHTKLCVREFTHQNIVTHVHTNPPTCPITLTQTSMHGRAHKYIRTYPHLDPNVRHHHSLARSYARMHARTHLLARTNVWMRPKNLFEEDKFANNHCSLQYTTSKHLGVIFGSKMCISEQIHACAHAHV